jgi:hypothetical protein
MQMNKIRLPCFKEEKDFAGWPENVNAQPGKVLDQPLNVGMIFPMREEKRPGAFRGLPPVN